jgi:hypothetical protein
MAARCGASRALCASHAPADPLPRPPTLQPPGPRPTFPFHLTPRNPSTTHRPYPTPPPPPQSWRAAWTKWTLATCWRAARGGTPYSRGVTRCRAARSSGSRWRACCTTSPCSRCSTSARARWVFLSGAWGPGRPEQRSTGEAGACRGRPARGRSPQAGAPPQETPFTPPPNPAPPPRRRPRPGVGRRRGAAVRGRGARRHHAAVDRAPPHAAALPPGGVVLGGRGVDLSRGAPSHAAACGRTAPWRGHALGRGHNRPRPPAPQIVHFDGNVSATNKGWW